MQEKSILEMARGAILERADYEMKRILDNISEAKSKLEPTNPIRTSLYTAIDNNGEIFIAENTPQVPGQLSIEGDIQEEPVILKIVKGA